jgi:threonine aldolase
MTSPVDLRSDTVTRPTAEMRRAMAEAAVGDDVYGEDPTVNELQERVADLLGKEAALFVPSGSMADQIAVRVLTRPGDAVLTAPDSHIAFHEAGATPALCGVQFGFLDGPHGLFDASAVRAAYHEDDHHHPPTTLVEVENSYNMGGGVVWPFEQLRAIVEVATELDMSTMLDGARLWNASVATEVPLHMLADGFDAVTVCLSKGLGAPVGSLIAGSRELIHRAHRVRKMLGGGMRQAGILAAAGLYALEHHRARLREDHDNARLLASGIEDIDGFQLASQRIDSNMVLVRVEREFGTAAQLQAAAARRGLLFWAAHEQVFRLVTHLDVSRHDCERALDILGELPGHLRES